mmetsp:Transcript_81455/g.174428  ORF Transcript_81455/g.174428 Transcript_81455/m.174428 type:complete len:216 (+) Transcript_81455:2140-2787(+)
MSVDHATGSCPSPSSGAESVAPDPGAWRGASSGDASGEASGGASDGVSGTSRALPPLSSADGGLWTPSKLASPPLRLPARRLRKAPPAITRSGDPSAITCPSRIRMTRSKWRRRRQSGCVITMRVRFWSLGFCRSWLKICRLAGSASVLKGSSRTMRSDSAYTARARATRACWLLDRNKPSPVAATACLLPMPNAGAAAVGSFGGESEAARKASR